MPYFHDTRPKRAAIVIRILRHRRSAHIGLAVGEQRFQLLWLHRDGNQRVASGIVVVEAPCQPLAFVDGKVDFQFVACASGGIGPRCCLDFGQVVFAAMLLIACPDAGGAIKKTRQLGKRDGMPIVIVARGVPPVQHFHERREILRLGSRPEVDRVAGPRRSHGRQRIDGVRISTYASRWIGVTPRGAPGVE